MTNRAWMIAAAVTCILGCSEIRGDDAAPETPEAPEASEVPSADRERTIYASMHVRVADVQIAVDDLRASIEAHGGYIESGNAASGAHARASFSLRVPQTDVSELRAEIRTLGTLESETEESDDITGERVELTARLTSARAEQARFIALMSQSTTGLQDVLAIERELARVTESIEALEANERRLDSDVRMASVSVELLPVELGPFDDPLGQLARTATTGLTVAATLVLALAVTVLALGPPFAVLALLVLLGRRALRSLRRPSLTT